MTRRAGEPLTSEEQFALRSELRGRGWISRIARPSALDGAADAAQTFEDVYRYRVRVFSTKRPKIALPAIGRILNLRT